MTRNKAAHQHYDMFQDIYVLLDDGDQAVLNDFALTRPQYALLVLLSPDDDKGQRLTTLSERLLYSKSQITRLVDQLEDEGLVERIADPHDRRAQQVVLTPKGIQRRAQANTAHQQSLQQRLGFLSQQEQQQLTHLLDKLRARLRADLSRSREENNGANQP